MDVIIFSGQSNMQGSTGEKGGYSAKGCLEYKFLSDEFVNLKDPVGEDIGDGVLCAAVNCCGSLVPSFCKAYSKKADKVVAVHCAKGNTAINDWKEGSIRYETLIKKSRKAIGKVRERFGLDKVYFVWLQGESDALNKTTFDDYLTALIALKNAVKRDLCIDKFCIIKVGFFAEYAYWKPESNKLDDLNIMKAQERASLVDNDFVLLTDVCAKLSVNKRFLNPKEYGPHYNNKGLKIIGKVAGKALIKTRKNRKQ